MTPGETAKIIHIFYFAVKRIKIDTRIDSVDIEAVTGKGKS